MSEMKEIKVSDFVPAFIEKLLEQLASDHKRWGDTWLKRPREGQEARTKARYDDYFDQFLLGKPGIPVPWLKVVGEALICWIRDNHPELCPDVNEVIAEDMEKIGLKPVSGVTGKGELIGISVSPEGVKDIHMPVVSSETPVPAEEVEERDGLLVLKEEKPVEEMTTKELVESEPPIVKQAELLGHMIESAALTHPIVHVVNETIEKTGLGKLNYGSGKDGRLILESIKFTKGRIPEPIGTCDAQGCIHPTSLTMGVVGRISSNGQYRLTLVKGVGPDDTIYVSYDYEFFLCQGVER